ncbi:hypothetical protein DMH15_41680 [Streptomyces sp. WAC 06725]|uniref:hypothetical protein n=1 Tax=Streptomyces sp. WAC 06725 TaxID=2203209 RepID=UPI000F737F73|nr:hypothetical protein [Streptomyces sp. WAC 06725]RSO08043.1 hypothetical protein DMH15_41680 [Streptomyces sp. WAC 06725]
MIFSEPDRLFKVWEYTVSHQTLLLRSDTDLSMRSLPRIEIYVGGVQTMFLHSMMRGLTVARADESEVAEISAKHGVSAEVGITYVLKAGNGLGFLVSGRPSWRKAVRDIDAPTLFDFTQPWPPGDDVSWGDVE